MSVISEESKYKESKSKRSIINFLVSKTSAKKTNHHFLEQERYV